MSATWAINDALNCFINSDISIPNKYKKIRSFFKQKTN